MLRLRQWIFANVRLLRWILINLGVGLAPFLLNLFFWAHGSSSDVWKFVSNSPDIWFITVTLCLTTLADLIDSALTKRIPHDMAQMALLTGCMIAVVMLIASGFYFMKTEQGIKLSKPEDVKNIRTAGWILSKESDKRSESPYHISMFCLSLVIAICTMYGTVKIERRIVLIEEVIS